MLIPRSIQYKLSEEFRLLGVCQTLLFHGRLLRGYNACSRYANQSRGDRGERRED